MKRIQVGFCNRERTVPGNNNWPRDGGALSSNFTINLSPQDRAFSRALKPANLRRRGGQN